MMPGIPGAGPGLWSGSAEEELARYEAWLTEHAIWSAMTGGRAGTSPGRTTLPPDVLRLLPGPAGRFLTQR